MANAKITTWKHHTNKNKMAPIHIRNVLGKMFKIIEETKNSSNDQRAKSCFYFEELNTHIRKALKPLIILNKWWNYSWIRFLHDMKNYQAIPYFGLDNSSYRVGRQLLSNVLRCEQLLQKKLKLKNLLCVVLKHSKPEFKSA